MRTAAQIISEIKDQYNMNGSELARTIGVEPSRINSICRGDTTTISNEITMALINAIPDLNPDFIVHGELPVRMTLRNREPSALSVPERIDMILDHYGINASQFAQSLNWNRSIISGLRSGVQYHNITPRRVRDIISQYPELSATWLSTGVGNMLADTQYETVTDVQEAFANLLKEKEILTKRNRDLEEKIEKLYKMIEIMAQMHGVPAAATSQMMKSISKGNTTVTNMAADNALDNYRNEK